MNSIIISFISPTQASRSQAPTNDPTTKNATTNNSHIYIYI